MSSSLYLFRAIHFSPLESFNKIRGTNLGGRTRIHTVRLLNKAIALLGKAKALSDGSGLVFPGTSQGKALSDMALSKLVKELGFDADVHGFRTSFKTWAQEKTGFANEVSEMALGHTIKNKAEAAYARSDLIEKRKEMMEQWAEYLAR